MGSRSSFANSNNFAAFEQVDIGYAFDSVVPGRRGTHAGESGLKVVVVNAEGVDIVFERLDSCGC